MKETEQPVSTHADERAQRFMMLYMSIQRYLYGFILSMVANCSDADDLIQETVTVMWAKFDEFEAGTDFGAWAIAIARYRILNYRQGVQTNRRRFSQSAFETIDQIAESCKEKEDFRRDALHQCISKLDSKDRNVLYLRYELGATLQSVAARLGQNTNTLYTNLSRIHIALLRCIQRKTFQEGLL